MMILKGKKAIGVAILSLTMIFSATFGLKGLRPTYAEENSTDIVAQAVTVIEPNDQRIVYNATWEYSTADIASTCTYQNYFTYTGNFTAIEWWGEKSENIIPAKIYLDGVLIINHWAVSDVSERNTSTLLFTSGVLESGEHTLKVEHNGENGGWINLDKLVVYNDEVETVKEVKDDTDTSITYGNFSAFGVGNTYYNSTVHSTNVKDAYYEFTEEHLRKFVIWSDRSWTRGKFDVYIDGEKMQTVNLYDGWTNDTTSYPVYVSPILSDEAHTVKVVVLGEKDIMATECWVALDKIELYKYKAEEEIQDPMQEFDNTSLGYVGSWGTYTNLGNLYYKGTANSTKTPGDYMITSFKDASKIEVWGTKSVNRGLADVYLDGQFIETIDTYSPTQTSSTVIWQKDDLPSGIHTLKIVCKGESSQGEDIWVEIDKIATKGADVENMVINALNSSFVSVKGATFVDKGIMGYYDISSNDLLTLTVKGTKINLFAPSGISGEANIIVDNGAVEVASITEEGGLFFELNGLKDEYHKIVIMNKSGEVGFAYATTDDAKLISIEAEMYNLAVGEIEDRKEGTWEESDPSTWNPVSYKYEAPLSGVTLTGGKMKELFDRNLNYLTSGMNLTDCVDSPQEFWVDILGGSNEGRLMQGYANSLIWGEYNLSYESALANMLVKIRARQIENGGYALPYDEIAMAGYNDAALDERRNYDRAMFTRGLVAAGNYYAYAGVPTSENPAWIILRDFYDWFNYNSNKYGEKMLEGFLGVQGHIGSTLTYFTPVGVTEDMLYAELSYVQNWWLEYLASGREEAVWKYPLNRPHCYLITALDAYLDHYRATGDDKYLNACFGFWKIMKENFIHEGGNMAICEHRYYEPGSYYLSEGTHTGELCGTVFWTDFNYKLLQLFPEEEKYASEIEESILNVLAVAQGTDGKIIYHQNLNGLLLNPCRINSCCEVTSVGLISRLPSFIYQLSNDGIKISLYNDSEINTTYNGKNYHLKMTGDIYGSEVYVIQNLGDATTLSLRIPSWVKGTPQILINGVQYSGEITLGSYLEISVNANDTISVTLPKEVVAIKYKGYEQVDGFDRYFFKYGPILYSVIPNNSYISFSDGVESVIYTECTIEEFIASISMQDKVAGKDAQFKFVPYSSVGSNIFSAVPLFKTDKTVAFDSQLPVYSNQDEVIQFGDGWNYYSENELSFELFGDKLVSNASAVEQKAIYEGYELQNGSDISFTVSPSVKGGRIDGGLYIGVKGEVSGKLDGATAYVVNIEKSSSSNVYLLKIHQFDYNNGNGKYLGCKAIVQLTAVSDSILTRVIYKDGNLFVYQEDSEIPCIIFEVGELSGKIGFRAFGLSMRFENIVLNGAGDEPVLPPDDGGDSSSEDSSSNSSSLDSSSSNLTSCRGSVGGAAALTLFTVVALAFVMKKIKE